MKSNRKSRKINDIKIGQKFGNRTVLSRVFSKNESLWEFKCSEGHIGITTGNSLRTLRQCRECYLINSRKEKGYSAFNNLYLAYKLRASNKKYSFELTKDEFKKLTQTNCHYCGDKPKRSFKKRSSYGDYIYNGIDRIDNTKGYELNNSVSCCTICNRAKRELSYNEFILWINNLIKFKGLST